MPHRLHLWAAAHAPWFLAATAGLTLLALAQLVDPRTLTLRLDVDPSLESVSTESEAEQGPADLARADRLRRGQCRAGRRQPARHRRRRLLR